MSSPTAMGDAPVVVIQEGNVLWRYIDFVETVEVREPAQLAPALARVERAAVELGLYAAGYISYEAAMAYGLATHALPTDEPPLAWFGLFWRRQPVQELDLTGEYAFGEWTPSISEAAYHAAVAVIKEAIAAGNTYQANLTFNLRASFRGDPWALYVALCRAQQASYTAYIAVGRHVICCASPELFFRRAGDLVTSRPMKGTAPRGLTAADDRAQAAWLHNSEKNRAENVMIVDMIRNDLGRVARIGSVNVPELFTIERYPTLLQMTSTVTAETSANLSELMAAAFPCASITGAPKVSTMTILRDLETEPRGIYTGSIGTIGPDGNAQFNVAIRTIVIDRQKGTARYGVGSGIVWDSEPDAEFAECLLKARVLAPNSALQPDFSLLESIRWMPDDGYWLLTRHLDRLVTSAEYFCVPLSREAVIDRLMTLATELKEPSKVRLLAAQDGSLTVESISLAAGEKSVPVRLRLAKSPVSSTDRWLYHKTTVRTAYALARADQPDCDDVVLYNERGEVTETTTANLVVDLDGQACTPSLSSGLLAGTLREELLACGELVERVITLDDLSRAGRIWIINSVRGMLAAELV